MIRRPGIIIFLSLLFFLEPIIKILWSSYLYKVSPTDMIEYEYYARDIIMFCMNIALVPLLGVMLYSVKKSAYIFLNLGFIFIIAFNLYELLNVSTEYSPENILRNFAPIFVNFLLLMILISGKTKKLYFNSNLRWWESDARYHFKCATSVIKKSGEGRLGAHFVNISESGALISEIQNLNGCKDIVLEFDQGEDSFKFPAEVVKDIEINGKKFHGIKFVNFTEIKKMQMKILINSLNKYSEKVRPEQEDFIQKIMSIIFMPFKFINSKNSTAIIQIYEDESEPIKKAE